MKRLYNSLQVALILCSLSTFPSEGLAQCDVWFNTYSNLCNLSTVILEAEPLSGVAPYTFLWETGETTQTILIPNALGDYMLTMTDATGCTAIINCHVKHWPNPVFYPFTGYACEGDTVQLGIDWIRDDIPGAIYEWSNGATGQYILATEDMTWTVTVTDPATGCEWVSEPQELVFDPRPDPEIEGSEEICGGQAIILTVTGGPYEYITWYPNYEWEETIVVTEPGLYWVSVFNVDNPWCSGEDTIIITPGEIPLPLISGPPDLCYGQTGTISITNHNEFEEFIWSNGETDYSFVAEEPGTYFVTVTDAGGCTAIESYTIEDAIDNELMADPTAATCGLSNGSIQLSYSISGSYTFEWSNGSTEQNLEDVPSGTYSVTVTDDDGCSAEIESVIPEEFVPIAINENIIPNSSCAGFNGSINLFITPEEPYEIIWSNGETTEDLVEISSGNYTITVSLGATCQEIETYFVDDISAAPDLQYVVAPASCGEANGQIDLQLNGGTAPFTFAWSNGNNAEDLFNLSAGSYTVTVTAADGCISTAAISVTDSGLPIDISALIQPNTSCSNANGSIDVSISPADNYTFVWSNGATTEDLTGIGAGEYIISATLGGCSETDTFSVTNSSLPFTITGNTTPNTSCNSGNGVIDISVTPAGSYTFQWTSGSVNEDLQNITGGVYTVTVTNTDGCAINSTFIVDNFASTFTVSGVTIANTSCIQPSGSIDLAITPAGTYTFLWSSGASSEDLQSVVGGTYYVTVSDMNSSCTSTAVFTIENNTADPIITATLLDEVCGEGNGAIDISITPSGSTVLWSTGTTTEDISGLSAGDYQVIATAPNGCTTSDTFSIANTSNSFSVSALSNDNSSCISPNGSLDLTVSPAGTYTFLWSNGAITEDLSNLAQGTYIVTITDQLNCSSTESFNIQSNTPDPVISQVIVPSTCGKANSQILLTISPSTGNSYSWSNGAGVKDLQSVIAGNYSVTVTSANGCSAIADFVVPDNNSNAQLSGVVTANKSCVNSNGAVDLNVTPSGSYTYTWSNGASTPDLHLISAGIYSVTVTDIYDCEFISTFNVGDNTINPAITYNVTPASCGQPNGSIDIQVSLSTNNSFLWSNNQTTQDLTLVNPGTYSVTVTSDQGCTATAVIEIQNQNSNFSISSLVEHNESCSTPEGGVDLTITPPGSYSFEWSNGTNTEDLTGISSGIYTVTVSDQFSCASSEEFIIEDLTVPPIISYNITPSTCGNQNGKIDVTVSPESPNNQFAWSNGLDVEDLTDIAEGIYTVTVTDENGCTAQGELTVPGSTPLELNIDADLLAVPVGGNVLCSLQLNVPLSAIDSILWLPQNLLSCTDPFCLEQNLTLNEQTEVSVMVTDTNGCFGQAFLMLTILKEYRVYIPNVFSPNRGGENDNFTIYTNQDVEEVVLLEIFDRWGNCVFINETFPPNIPNYGWDGTFSEKEMNPDVFAYRAVVRFSNGEEHRYKGDVTLVK